MPHIMCICNVVKLINVGQYPFIGNRWKARALVYKELLATYVSTLPTTPSNDTKPFNTRWNDHKIGNQMTHR